MGRTTKEARDMLLVILEQHKVRVTRIKHAITGSIYIQLGDMPSETIRIAAHSRDPQFLYRWSIRTDMAKRHRVNHNGVDHYVYPATEEDMECMVRNIKRAIDDQA